jgi:hypothetical protein
MKFSVKKTLFYVGAILLFICVWTASSYGLVSFLVKKYLKNVPTRTFGASPYALPIYNQSTIALSNGLNSNVAVSNSASVRFTYSSNVILGGLVMTPAPQNGQNYDLHFLEPATDAGALTATIRNQDSSSTAGDRFCTTTGQDYLLPPGQVATARVIYDGTSSCFRLVQNSPSAYSTINVSDFGSACTPSVDYGGCIQAAINYATASYTNDPASEAYIGGGHIVIPPGYWTVKESINIPCINPINLTIEGAVEGATFLLGSTPTIDGLFRTICAPNTAVGLYLTIKNLAIGVALPYATAWQPNHTYSTGAIVLPSRPSDNTAYSNLLMVATTGGTSGSVPSFGTMAAGEFSDPIITITGTPSATYPQIYVNIGTGGSRSVATFQYSLNGGQSFNGTYLSMSSGTYTMSGTGLTLNFGTGTYVASEGSLTGPGNYSSNYFGYQWSSIHDTTITDGTVTWTLKEGAGILLVDAGYVTLSHLTIYDWPVQIILDGTEVSTVEKSNLNGYNGIWLPAFNIRRNNQATDINQGDNTQSNADTLRDNNYGNVQDNVIAAGNINLKFDGWNNFESGIHAVKLTSEELVTIPNLEMEGITGAGLDLGNQVAFVGLGTLYNTGITVSNSLIACNAGPAIQLNPQAGYPAFAYDIASTNISLQLNSIYFSSSGVNITGGYNAGSIRITDPINGEPTFDSVPTSLIYENTSNGGNTPQFGIGVLPNTGIAFDTQYGYASRGYQYTVSSTPVENVNMFGTSYVEATTTANWTIGGMSDGQDGLHRQIFNAAGGADGGVYTMTIANQDTGSSASNRIYVPTGANKACTVAELVYSINLSRWVLVSCL